MDRKILKEILKLVESEWDKIPMFGSEGEILGISPKIVKIVDKVIGKRNN